MLEPEGVAVQHRGATRSCFYRFLGRIIPRRTTVSGEERRSSGMNAARLSRAAFLFWRARWKKAANACYVAFTSCWCRQVIQLNRAVETRTKPCAASRMVARG